MTVTGQETVTAVFRALGILPVIVTDDPLRTVELGEALIDGGLPCAEITLRTPGALESVRRMADAHPDLLVGAGTVLSERQAAKAIEAGAKFIVAPGFSDSVVNYCLDRGTPVYPGVCTPTEIEMALERGVNEVKFFPAEAMGGVDYLKAVSAPYRDVRFMPTGGISPANISSYLALGCVIACGGSWVAPSELIASGRFDDIRKLVRAAVGLVRERVAA